MRLTPHSDAWYDRLAQMQEGYYFPWRSRVAPLNGEDAYADLVRRHLSPECDVLDVGCGHGEFTLTLASSCRTLLAYDRVAPYLRLGQRAAARAGIRNVVFVRADASARFGPAALPFSSHAFDLIISRRGPLHWIEEAPRIARPGAVLIQLNPILEACELPWHSELPRGLRPEDSGAFVPPWSMRESVERRLARVGLALHSCWTFDVPEFLEDAEQLYVMLTWGSAPEEVPAFDEVRGELEAIFSRHAGPDGLVTRHRRFLWKSVVG